MKKILITIFILFFTPLCFAERIKVTGGGGSSGGNNWTAQGDTGADLIGNTAETWTVKGGIASGHSTAESSNILTINQTRADTTTNGYLWSTDWTTFNNKQATIANYVATVADGTGIDGTASGAGSTYTPTLDTTEVGNTTWGDGTAASITHTFNVSGTDTSITFSSAVITFNPQLDVSQEFVTGGDGAINVANFRSTDGNAGADLAIGDGVAVTFYVPEATDDEIGGRIIVERESATDTNTASSMNIQTAGDNGTLATVLTLDSAKLATFAGGLTSTAGTTTLGTLAGAIDAGGATSLEVPNTANPTVDTTGEIGVDTTDDQFLYMGASVLRTIPYTYERCFTIEDIAVADDNVPIWSPKDAITVTNIYCRTQGGTSAEIIISDGTNVMETITCDSDGQADDGSLVNNTFTANERMEFDTGTVTGAVDWCNVCISYTIDRQ